MKTSRIINGFSAVVLSLASLSILVVTPVKADATATHAWIGGGGDNNFSTAANWDVNEIPATGDAVVFNELSSDVTVNLDADFSVSTLSLNCTDQTYGFTINGTGTLTVAGNVSSSCYNTSILTTLNVGANIGIFGGGDGLGIALLTGSGDISITGTLVVSYARPDYTGNITVESDAILIANEGAFTNSSSGKSTTVEDGGMLALDCVANKTVIFDEPIVIAGTGYNMKGHSGALSLGSNYLEGPGTEDDHCHITLSSLTLSANASVGLNEFTETTVTNLNKGSHILSLIEGGSGKITLPGSQAQTPAPLVTTISGSQGNLDPEITSNNILVVTGTVGDVTVDEGGILKGNGTVGDVDVDGGTVAPGLSPGVINTGDLTYTGGTLEEEIGGTTAGNFDQVNVTGAVDLGSAVTTLTVTHWNGFTPALNNSFVIINNDGVDAVTGTFTGLAQGGTLTVGGYTYTISYTGGTGNDVVLTVTGVPPVATPTPTPTPKAPNTGMALMKVNPAILLVGGLMIAAGLSLLARRQLKK